jgi:pimeloyl-ACP methyl ester carboxylesterase
MMDYIAQQGWDVYLVDVPGYGGSQPSMPCPLQLPLLRCLAIARSSIALQA